MADLKTFAEQLVNLSVKEVSELGGNIDDFVTLEVSKKLKKKLKLQ